MAYFLIDMFVLYNSWMAPLIKSVETDKYAILKSSVTEVMPLPCLFYRNYKQDSTAAVTYLELSSFLFGE